MGCFVGQGVGGGALGDSIFVLNPPFFWFQLPSIAKYSTNGQSRSNFSQRFGKGLTLTSNMFRTNKFRGKEKCPDAIEQLGS